jgi:hypothetical protein
MIWENAMTATKATHTPGPWMADRRNSCWAILSQQHNPYVVFVSDHHEYGGKPCGSVCSQDKPQAEIDANARLIAAAPQLLAACAAAYGTLYDRTSELGIQMAEAIRAARGE